MSKIQSNTFGGNLPPACGKLPPDLLRRNAKSACTARRKRSFPREELATLTGRKSKRHQVDALKRMGIAFFVNATGHAIVTRAAVEGKPEQAPSKRTWSPK
jgi:hypothetical protein